VCVCTCNKAHDTLHDGNNSVTNEHGGVELITSTTTTTTTDDHEHIKTDTDTEMMMMML